MKIVVDNNKCPKNHRCPAISICPVNAIKQEGYNAPTIDYKLCINCGRCTRFCPTGALKIEK